MGMFQSYSSRLKLDPSASPYEQGRCVAMNVYEGDDQQGPMQHLALHEHSRHSRRQSITTAYPFCSLHPESQPTPPRGQKAIARKSGLQDVMLPIVRILVSRPSLGLS